MRVYVIRYTVNDLVSDHVMELQEMPLTIAPAMPRKKYGETPFGKRLAALRKARGMTQIQLAKAAATTQRAISYYENDTGFDLSAGDQLTYNVDLAAVAHSYGLSVGLKNDVGQLSQLEDVFDFAINEQCARYNECTDYGGWIAAHKAVVEIEYHLAPARFCPAADAAGRDAVAKSVALRAKPWKPCR